MHIYAVKNVENIQRGGNLGSLLRAVVLGPIRREAAAKIPSRDLIWTDGTKPDLDRKLNERFPRFTAPASWHELSYAIRSPYEKELGLKELGIDNQGSEYSGRAIAVLNTKCLPSEAELEDIVNGAKQGGVLIQLGDKRRNEVLSVRGMCAEHAGWEAYYRIFYDLERWTYYKAQQDKNKIEREAWDLRPVDAPAHAVHDLRRQMAEALHDALRKKMLGKIKTDIVSLKVSEYAHKAGVAARRAKTIFDLGCKIFGNGFWKDKLPKFTGHPFQKWDDKIRKFVNVQTGVLLDSIREHQAKKHAKYPPKKRISSRILWDLVWMWRPRDLRKLKRGTRVHNL